jgi:hypothetical protein
LRRLYQVSSHDTTVLGAFYRVMHMLDTPGAMLRPGIALRVLRG